MLKKEQYELAISKSSTIFEFVSVGKRGHINKVVEFSVTDTAEFYNLGFGDKDETTGRIDDKITSDNGDGLKVLATVASAVYLFTTKHPNAWIFAVGSTPSRNRLYRIGITKNLAEIERDFAIFGFIEGEWKPFVPNLPYKAFLVKRKL